jgi:hypothetical protein
VTAWVAGCRAAAIACIAGVVVVGCAGQRYVQDTTEIAAGHVGSLQRDYERYLRRVERDAAARIDLLADERQRLARAEQGLWEAMAERSLHDALMAEGDERIKIDRAIAQRADTERKALSQDQKRIERDAVDRLKELAKQLHELATPAPFKDQVQFLVEYFQAVNKAVSDLDAKAREAKKTADKAQSTSAQE